jgi:hypothetical protein
MIKEFLAFAPIFGDTLATYTRKDKYAPQNTLTENPHDS